MLSTISTLVTTVSIAGIFLSQVGGPSVLGDRIAQGPRRDVQTQNFQERANQARQEATQEFETKQEEARERAEQRRQEVQERIQEIRDEQKRRVAERLVANLDTVNQNWVNHWLRVLDRLTEVLVKMESRADKLEELGHDVSEARAMIAAAHDAIAQAQDVLNEQAGKTYEIEFTDENDLGSGIQAAIQELHADLRATQQEVQNAIEATRDALSSLKSSADSDADNGDLDNGDDDPEESTEGAELDV